MEWVVRLQWKAYQLWFLSAAYIVHYCVFHTVHIAFGCDRHVFICAALHFNVPKHRNTGVCVGTSPDVFAAWHQSGHGPHTMHRTVCPVLQIPARFTSHLAEFHRRSKEHRGHGGRGETQTACDSWATGHVHSKEVGWVRFFCFFFVCFFCFFFKFLSLSLSLFHSSFISPVPGFHVYFKDRYNRLEIMYAEELWADTTFALFNIDEGYVYKSAPVEAYIKRTAVVLMILVDRTERHGIEEKCITLVLVFVVTCFFCSLEIFEFA